MGLVNVCVGFSFAGNNKAIIGFVIITILMIIVVTSTILLKRRRKMKRQAMNTPAAMNFREGQRDGAGHGVERVDGGAPPKYEGPAIPLQSYQSGGREQYR